MKWILKGVHNNFELSVITVKEKRINDFQQCSRALLGGQISIGSFTIDLVPVLLQAMKLYIWYFVPGHHSTITIHLIDTKIKTG